MPLDTSEAINAAFAALAMGQDILAAVQALPPKAGRKAVDYGPILQLIHDKVLPLVDQIEADIAD